MNIVGKKRRNLECASKKAKRRRKLIKSSERNGRKRNDRRTKRVGDLRSSNKIELIWICRKKKNSI